MTTRMKALKQHRESIARKREIIKCITAFLIAATVVTLGCLGKLHVIFIITTGALLYLWLDK